MIREPCIGEDRGALDRIEGPPSPQRHYIHTLYIQHNILVSRTRIIATYIQPPDIYTSPSHGAGDPEQQTRWIPAPALIHSCGEEKHEIHGKDQRLFFFLLFFRQISVFHLFFPPFEVLCTQYISIRGGRGGDMWVPHPAPPRGSPDNVQRPRSAYKHCFVGEHLLEGSIRPQMNPLAC